MHEIGVSLLKHIKISYLMRNKRSLSYVLVRDIKTIRKKTHVQSSAIRNFITRKTREVHSSE